MLSCPTTRPPLLPPPLLSKIIPTPPPILLIILIIISRPRQLLPLLRPRLPSWSSTHSITTFKIMVLVAVLAPPLTQRPVLPITITPLLLIIIVVYPQTAPHSKSSKARPTRASPRRIASSAKWEAHTTATSTRTRVARMSITMTAAAPR